MIPSRVVRDRPALSLLAGRPQSKQRGPFVHFSFTISFIALWIFVIFQGLLVLAVLQHLTRIRHLTQRNSPTSDRLLVGSPAPELVGADSESAGFSVSRFLGTGGLVLFVSSSCSICKTLVESIGDAATDRLPPIIGFCVGHEPKCGAFAKRLGPHINLEHQRAAEAAALYGVSEYPTVVIIDSAGRIGGYLNPRTILDLKPYFVRERVVPLRADDPAFEHRPSQTL